MVANPFYFFNPLFGASCWVSSLAYPKSKLLGTNRICCCCSCTGGKSSGCLDNAGAAGTLYEEVPKSITVNNDNLSTQTDTVFLDPPYEPLWTNILIRNRAKVSLPLRWSRIQVECLQYCLIDSVANTILLQALHLTTLFVLIQLGGLLLFQGFSVLYVVFKPQNIIPSKS